MIALLLMTLPPDAAAVERERVLDVAAEFATHEWTMTSANQTASCSDSWSSDYTPGTWVGIPYDWGGWVTTEEYDDRIDEGYGAGSHSWHGVLSCTVGVDCSGFVSQTWGTSIKYGTSTFYQVTSEISTSAIERGDALNDAGSHVVLFTHESDAGLPIHYEANGGVVFVDSDQGWSSFSSYVAIRYEDIEDGPTTGTADAPIEVESFPLYDEHWTAGAASDVIDSYSCAPDTEESGPEVFYRFEAATAGTLHVTVSDGDGVDIDVHVLDAPRGDACLDRDDSEITIDLEPGEYWIVTDSYTGSYEYPGPYLLSASFSGELGDSGVGGTDPDPGDGSGDGGSGDGGSGDGGSGDGGSGDGGSDSDDGLGDPSLDFVGAPGEHVLVNDLGGCSHGPSGAPGGLAGLLALLVGLAARRR